MFYKYTNIERFFTFTKTYSSYEMHFFMVYTIAVNILQQFNPHIINLKQYRIRQQKPIFKKYYRIHHTGIRYFDKSCHSINWAMRSKAFLKNSRNAYIIQCTNRFKLVISWFGFVNRWMSTIGFFFFRNQRHFSRYIYINILK